MGGLLTHTYIYSKCRNNMNNQNLIEENLFFICAIYYSSTSIFNELEVRIGLSWGCVLQKRRKDSPSFLILFYRKQSRAYKFYTKGLPVLRLNKWPRTLTRLWIWRGDHKSTIWKRSNPKNENGGEQEL